MTNFLTYTYAMGGALLRDTLFKVIPFFELPITVIFGIEVAICAILAVAILIIIIRWYKKKHKK